MTKKRALDVRSSEEILSKLDSRSGLPRHGRDARDVVEHLKDHLEKELSDEEIARALGLSSMQRLQTLKERMYAAEEEALGTKTPTRIFVDYRLRQLSCIRRLDAIADACLAGNQAAGAVGAVKAKADLYDRMLVRGQELGVLARKPKEVHLIGRIDVRHMSTEDLKRQIAEENRALARLVETLDAPTGNPRARLEGTVEGTPIENDAGDSEPGDHGNGE